MADKTRRLGIGIQLDLASIKGELERFRSMISEVTKGISTAGTGQNLTSTVRTASEELKRIKADLAAYQKAQARDIAREEIAAAKQANAEILALQKARISQAAAVNKSLTASGGYSWLTGGMDSSTRSQMASFYKEQAKEAQAAARATDEHGISIGNLTTSLLKLYGAYYVLKSIVESVSSFFMSGINAIDEYNLSIAKMAAMMTGMMVPEAGKSLADQYREAYGYAGQLMVMIEQVDKETLLTAKDLRQITEEMLKQGVLVDTNNAKEIQAFTAISNALAVISAGYPNKEIQLRQEIRALLQGELKDSNQLAKMLEAQTGDLKNQIALHRQQGDLIIWLGDQLKGFTAAQNDINSSWEAMKTTLQTIYEQILRAGFQTAFSDITKSAKELSEWAVSHKAEIAALVDQGYVGIKTAIKDVVGIAAPWKEELKGILVVVGEIVTGIQTALQTMRLTSEGAKEAFSKGYVGPAALGYIGNYVASGVVREAQEQRSQALLNLITPKRGETATGEKPDLVSPSEKNKKGGGGAYKTELSAAKEHAKAMLEIEKSNYQLRFKELSNYYKLGYLTSDEYYDAEVKNAEQHMRSQIKELELEKKKIQEGYDQGMSQKNVTGDKKKALTDKKDAELENVDAKTQKVLNEYYGKLSDIGTQAYQKRVQLVMEELQHEINMEKLAVQEIVAQNQWAVEEQQKQTQWLYSNGMMNAAQYYSKNANLIQQNKEVAIQALQVVYDAWKKDWDKRMSYAEGKKDQIKVLNRELEEKDRELANNMAQVNRQATTQMNENYRNLAGTFNEAFVTPMKSGLKDFFDYSSTGFLDFKNLALNVVHDIYMQMVEKFILSGLTSIFTGGTSSVTSTIGHEILSLFGSAKGNVFSTPGLSPYLNTVVSSPTLFKFASGVGLMGEAGEEAIMPLRRTRSGDLGVQATGGGASNVSISVKLVNQSGQQLTATKQSTSQGASAQEYIVTVWLDALDRNAYGLRSAIGR